jgi:hypothetical protein
MARFKQNFSFISAVLFALLLTACGKKEENVQPASGPATPPQTAPVATPAQAQPSAPPASTPTPEGNVLASGQYSDNPDLRCDLLQVKRVSGGALMIRWRAVYAAASSSGLAASQSKSIYYDPGWDQLYYVDPAENKKYGVLKDSDNNAIGDQPAVNFSPGQQHAYWAKFPAPPPSSTKISVSIPKFPPFEDVPVAP